MDLYGGDRRRGDVGTGCVARRARSREARDLAGDKRMMALVLNQSRQKAPAMATTPEMNKVVIVKSFHIRSHAEGGIARGAGCQ